MDDITITEAADLDLDTRDERHELARRMMAALSAAQSSVNHPALDDLAEFIAILATASIPPLTSALRRLGVLAVERVGPHKFSIAYREDETVDLDDPGLGTEIAAELRRMHGGHRIQWSGEQIDLIFINLRP